MQVEARGFTFDVTEGGLVVKELDGAAIGAIAHRAGVPLSLLAEQQEGLESAFLELTGTEPEPPPGTRHGAHAAPVEGDAS